jgi:hypothetical protein
MPPSLRFLGRRVYVGALVIAASILERLRRATGAARPPTGVPSRTVRRWLTWWQGLFLSSEVFVAIRARLIDVAVDALPTSIFDRLTGGADERMRTMLLLLAPLTTCSLPDARRFLRGVGAGDN